jgi:hypothetical protein
MASLAPSAQLGKEPKPESYLGSWTLYCRSEPIAIRLTERDDTVVPHANHEKFAGLKGDRVTALVDKRDSSQVELTVLSPQAGRPAIHFQGRLLSRERGIVAGTAGGGALPKKSSLWRGAGSRVFCGSCRDDPLGIAEVLFEFARQQGSRFLSVRPLPGLLGHARHTDLPRIRVVPRLA